MQEDILVIPTLGSHYADEVQSYAFTTTQDILPQSSTREVLQPLSKALIERTLDAVELNHNCDREGDVYSIFSGEGLPADMTCWYLIVGEDKDILRLLCTVRLPVAQEKWGHALLLCNQYHGMCRFGKCYLDIVDGHPEARLFVESLIDLSDGVSDGFLQRFVMLSLYAAHVFFERTRKEKLYAPARRKKRNQINSHKEGAVIA